MEVNNNMYFCFEKQFVLRFKLPNDKEYIDMVKAYFVDLSYIFSLQSLDIYQLEIQNTCFIFCLITLKTDFQIAKKILFFINEEIDVLFSNDCCSNFKNIRLTLLLLGFRNIPNPFMNN